MGIKKDKLCFKLIFSLIIIFPSSIVITLSASFAISKSCVIITTVWLNFLFESLSNAIISSLDADLPQSFDKDAFDSKINLLLNHFVDMSVQHYGWLGETA